MPTASGVAAAAVCDLPARAPATERPLRSTTIGVLLETWLAIRRNRRGLPIDSRYSAITWVRGSRSQYSSMSLPLTSALLPRDTKPETPSRRRLRASSTAMPRAPD